MFMNRVHEQCPKNLTQENTESKRIESGPSAPSAQPPASPRTQPRPGRAPRAPTCLARPARLPPACALRARALLQSARPTRARSRAPACVPSALPPARPACARRCLRAQHTQLPSPLSQYNFVLRYSLASCSLLQYNTLYCNTALQQPFQSIAIQSSLYLCNTNHCIATQKPIY